MTKTQTVRIPPIALLRENPTLARVCAAQALNSFGSSMAPIALAFTALEGGEGLIGLAVILCATALGPAIVTLFGGVAADSGNRAHLILVSRLISGVLQSITGVLVITGITAPWVLGLLSFGMSSLVAYTIPASRAMVRDLAGPESLQRGTALMSLCIDTARLLGPGLAATLLVFTPNGVVLLLDAATFFLSAFFMRKVKLAPLPPRTVSSLAQLRSGLRYSTRQRWLLTTALCGMVVNGAWMAGYQLLGPDIAHQDYGGASFWGICGVAYMAGLLAGGFLALHLTVQNPIEASVAASASLALPLAAIGFQLPAAVVVISIAIATCLLALAMTWWMAGVPKYVERDHLARAFSFNSAIELGGVPIAYAAVGVASATAETGPQSFVLLAGGLVVIASIVNVLVLATVAKPAIIKAEVASPAISHT